LNWVKKKKILRDHRTRGTTPRAKARRKDGTQTTRRLKMWNGYAMLTLPGKEVHGRKEHGGQPTKRKGQKKRKVFRMQPFSQTFTGRKSLCSINFPAMEPSFDVRELEKRKRGEGLETALRVTYGNRG